MSFALLDNLGTTEILICGIAALLVFGRRLPEVAAQAGATLSKFKRNLDDAIHESGVEKEIRKIKQAMPTDLSVRDVARAATRKVEDRMRALADEANRVESEVTSALAPPPDPPRKDPPAASTPPEAARNDGMDPAKHFGPPGSVPRE